MSINGTLVEDKMRRFKGEYAHFSFNKCLIYTHDGASPKFGPNSHETDNSVVLMATHLYTVRTERRKIRLIEGNAKCRHLKN